MKVQLIYSSLSGKTKRLAEYLYNSLQAEEKSIHDLKEGVPVLDGDIILLGYWVDKGGPNKDMQEFMKTVKGKTVGVFCTLGFYADSAHAINSIRAGADLLAQENTIIGSYVCNGAISENMIAAFRKNSAGPHSAIPENEIRWDIMKGHPTQAEMELAAERFQERIEIYRRYQAEGLTFQSIR